MNLIKKNVTERYKRSGYSYEDINEVVNKLNININYLQNITRMYLK